MLNEDFFGFTSFSIDSAWLLIRNVSWLKRIAYNWFSISYHISSSWLANWFVILKRYSAQQILISNNPAGPEIKINNLISSSTNNISRPTWNKKIFCQRFQNRNRQKDFEINEWLQINIAISKDKPINRSTSNWNLKRFSPTFIRLNNPESVCLVVERQLCVTWKMPASFWRT
jgi:hypothetical protein